jgi:hypothetical protein
MHIDVAPETERLIREEIRSGHVRSVDEIIEAGVQALRGRLSRTVDTPGSDAKNLVELFSNSPFKGLGLDFERDQDYGRDVEL